MSVRRRGSGWQVRVPGFPSQTVPTKRMAVALEEQRKAQRLGLTMFEHPELLGAEMDGFIARKETVGGVKPRTVEYLERCAAGWEGFRGRRVDTLTRREVENHVLARAAKHPRSAKNELEFLKAVLRDSVARGQRVSEQLFAVPSVKHRPRIGSALTPDQVDEIAAHMPDYVKRIAPVALRTGLRIGELFNLRTENLNLDAGTLAVLNSKTNAGVRTVRLSAATCLLLREQLLARPAGAQYVFTKAQGGQWRHNHFRDRVWLPAVQAAGHDTVTFHLLRHSAVAYYAQAGWRMEHIAEQLGWTPASTAAMFARYRHLLPTEMDERIRQLDAFESMAVGGTLSVSAL